MTGVQTCALPILAEVAASAQADGPILDAEQRARRVALHGAIARAIATLDNEDQMIVRLRFYEGFSVADVARALALAQKPLYTRLTRVLQALSTALTRDGIGRQALEFFESP